MTGEGSKSAGSSLSFRVVLSLSDESDLSARSSGCRVELEP